MATSSLSCGKLTALTSTYALLQIFGLLLFVIGFFPVKPPVPGVSGPESYRMPTCEDALEVENESLLPGQLAKMFMDLSQILPAFDRMIFMVIDGLPAEFVLGRDGHPPEKSLVEAMPYTHYLLSEKRAIAYHAKAAPPTVTMPRLKAMISGAIGGYVDLAFNFHTQAFLDDNLLDQFYRIGWKLVMFGDDTWIKLFPSLFSRFDGVSSFYVKDTVEVDFNVSRHLEVEFAADDWKLMILHYLGLDHIGHIGGRHSPLMASKLREMDDIIRLVDTHNALKGDDYGKHTLLVVVSDHGLTEKGNHGGSSYEETDSLVLFVDLWAESPIYPPNLDNEVFQVDVTPTLALLFGVPIPKNSIGVLLIQAFNSLTDEHKLRVLELNSWQLLRLLQVHMPGLLCRDFKESARADQVLQSNEYFGNIKVKLYNLYLKARAAHSLWKLSNLDSSSTSNNSANLNAAVASYYDFLRYGSEWLSHRATDLLLQQPVNAIPILLLFGQIMAFIIYFSEGQHHQQFVEVAALYFLGMAGHFSLGNSNTLATIDVAGAYIGISSHSVVFPGILMFIITFSSPILSYLSMVVSISMKDIVSFFPSDMSDLSHVLKLMIIFPCLVPLVLNSVILTTFTIILLLMRNHLFIWSVFSPKYLYLCAGTLSIYIGLFVVAVTVIYTCTAFFFRAKMLKSRD